MIPKMTCTLKRRLRRFSIYFTLPQHSLSEFAGRITLEGKEKIR